MVSNEEMFIFHVKFLSLFIVLKLLTKYNVMAKNEEMFIIHLKYGDKITDVMVSNEKMYKFKFLS